MTYAVCHISISSLRSSANNKSEQISQVLFGEVFTVIDQRGKWVRVLTQTDAMLGWMLKDHLSDITVDEFNDYNANQRFNIELFHPVFTADSSFHIPFGAKLPRFDGLGFVLAGKRYTFSGRTIELSEQRIEGEWICKIARLFLHAPQLPGGRSSFGMDANAFIQLVFAAAAIKINRSPLDLLQKGKLIDFVEEAKAGDLAFFEKRKGYISHMGIILDNNRVIHVDGVVRIDQLDHFGVFNKETQKYSYKLRIMRRLLINDHPIDFNRPKHAATTQAKQIEMF